MWLYHLIVFGAQIRHKCVIKNVYKKMEAII